MPETLPRVNAGDPAAGGPVDYPRFSDAERDRRWANVRALMQRAGIDVIVGFPNSHLFDSFQASTRYLTGIGGNCASVGVIFPLAGDATAIVSPDQDADYLRAVQDWVADIRNIAPDWAYAPRYVERLGELGAASARIGVIGLVGNTRYAEGSASHGLITTLQQAFPRAEIVDATFVLDQARYVKSDEELRFIEQATRLAERALDVLRTEARPGLPERALIARLLASMVEQGGDLPTMILWSAGWPQPPTNHYQPTGRVLGMARAALETVLEQVRQRGIAYTVYTSQADAPTTQLQLALAAEKIDTAHLHAYRAAADIDQAAAAGVYLDRLTRARVRMDTGYVARQCREAIEILLSVNGAGSFAESNPLQRMWRDAETASRHAVVNPDICQELYGRELLGLDTNITP